MRYKYRVATINIPRAGYADNDWRELPPGERILYVFAGTMVADGSLVVLVEKEEREAGSGS